MLTLRKVSRFLVLFLCSLMIGISGAKEKLLIGSGFDPDGIHYKIGSEVLTYAYKAIGYEIELKDMPLDRAIVSSRNALIDGNFMRVKQSVAPFKELIVVDEKLLDYKMITIYIDDNIEINEVSDLAKYTTVTIQGATVIEGFINRLNMSYQTVNNYSSLINMLFHNRVDVIFYSVLDYMVLQSKWDEQTKAKVKQTEPVFAFELFHVVNEKHKKLVPLLENQIRLMKENGQYDQIIELSIQSYK